MRLNEGFTGLGLFDTEKKGEVYVTLASGVPSVSTVGKSNLITVQPSNAKLPIKGYSLKNGNLEKIIMKAAEDGSQLLMRFEKQRKRGVDNSIPMSELTPDMATARKNVVNSCVGVYDINNKKWIIEGGYSDPNSDGEEAGKFINWICSGAKEEVNLDEFFEKKEAPKATAPNPTTFDKQQAVLSIYFWLMSCEEKYKFTLKEEGRRSLTVKLLKLTDKLYELLKDTDINHINYGEYTNTRSRFALFKYGEEVNPLNEEAIKQINNWASQCYNYYMDLLQWTKTV